MAIRPILSALRRHKAGTILIALQIALTLAIVCNALFIIGMEVARVGRSSGLDESDLLAVYTGGQAGVDAGADTQAGQATLRASIHGDLTALRRLPDVADAYETNSLPLLNFGQSRDLRLTPEQRDGVGTSFFNADEHSLVTLGVHLIGGRNFHGNEIGDMGPMAAIESVPIIVTRHLADSLFPRGDALGKQVYFSGQTKPCTIVGVIERMQSPVRQGVTDNDTWNVALVPLRRLHSWHFYVVRTRPGRLAAAMQSVPAALYAQDPQRVIPDGEGEDAGVRSFAQLREQAYQSDRAMVQLLTVISVILLVVTSAGIVGLSSFWVGQRRKQIGVRRALGATRGDILAFFHTENLLISLGGVALGSVLAIGLNLGLVTQFEMARLPLWYVGLGVVVLLLLGQGAVWAPALRASQVPPVEATRTI